MAEQADSGGGPAGGTDLADEPGPTTRTRRLTRRAVLLGGGVVAAGGLAAAGVAVFGGSSPSVAWKFSEVIHPPVGLPRATLPSPAVAGGIVYASDAVGHLHAFRAADGTRRWSRRLDGPSGPVAAPGVVYVSDVAGVVHALRAADGAPLWSAPTGPAPRNFRYIAPAPPLTLAGGTIYAGRDHLYALRAADGSRLWTFPRSNLGVAGPVVSDGLVYLGLPGGLAALRAADGSQVWHVRTTSVTSQVALPAAGPPGIVYTGTDYGLAALRTTNGAMSWAFKQSSPAYATWPATGSGRVFFVDSNADLFALSAANGTRLWNFRLGMTIDSSPVAAGRTVYGAGLGGTYALRAAGGAQLWHFPASSTSGPVTGPDGTIYLVDSALPFTLYALRP